MAEKKAILFVCLGNICRSPIAYCVFKHLLKAQNKEDQWTVSSAGIGHWHVGKRPDSRAIGILGRYQVPSEHTARQIKDKDLEKFDYVVVMDDENYEDIKNIQYRTDKANTTKPGQKVLYLGDYDPEGIRQVKDPYYSTDLKAFSRCYDHISRCCENLLKKLENNEIIEPQVNKTETN